MSVNCLIISFMIEREYIFSRYCNNCSDKLLLNKLLIMWSRKPFTLYNKSKKKLLAKKLLIIYKEDSICIKIIEI